MKDSTYSFAPPKTKSIIALMLVVIAALSNSISWADSYVYDTQSRLTSITYDDAGNIEQVVSTGVVPNPITGLQILGPSSITEGGSASYSLQATYQDTSTATLDQVLWSSSSAFAYFNNGGSLTATQIAEDISITLTAEIQGQTVQKTVTVTVTVTDQDGAGSLDGAIVLEPKTVTIGNDDDGYTDVYYSTYSPSGFDVEHAGQTYHINTLPGTYIGGTFHLKSGTLDLEGQSLTINGSLYQTGGTLIVNGGNLIINGNYKIDNGGAAVSARVYMNNINDYIRVDGDFVMNSGHNNSGYFSAGLLELKGNFTQRGSGTYSRYNFDASGTHKVLLSGSALQTISFEAPGYSNFTQIEITNNTGAGVLFDTNVVSTSLFNHNLKPFTLQGTSNSFIDFDGDGLLDHEDPYPTIAGPVDTDGDGIEDYLDSDNDGDGLSNAYELAYGLDPMNPADAASSDAWLDSDGDGITNYQEFLLGTDPMMKDSDFDGASDEDEVVAGTDPLDSQSIPSWMMPSRSGWRVILQSQP